MYNYPLDCVVVNVGTGSSNSKTVHGKIEYECPKSVDRHNWFGGESYKDSFSVDQKGAQITVTRVDASGGWGMDLKFECCKAGKLN